MCIRDSPNTDPWSYPNLFMKGGWVEKRLNEINNEAITEMMLKELAEAKKHRMGTMNEYDQSNTMQRSNSDTVAGRNHLVMATSLDGVGR